MAGRPGVIAGVLAYRLRVRLQLFGPAQQRREIEAVAQLAAQFFNLGPKIARPGGVIQRQHRVVQQMPERVRIDARVAMQQHGIDLVAACRPACATTSRTPRPCGRLRCRARRPRHRAAAGRLLAHAHEHGWARRCPRTTGRRRGSCECPQSARLRSPPSRGRTAQLAAASASASTVAPLPPVLVDVHVRDAAPIELVPVLIGIPGRAGIAAVRMAGPEAQRAVRAAIPRAASAHSRATSTMVALACRCP